MQSLCTLVAVPGGQSHTKQAIAFLAAEEDGLLAHKRFQRDEVLLVVQQLAVLAKAFLARNGKKQPAGIALPDFYPPGDVVCLILVPCCSPACLVTDLCPAELVGGLICCLAVVLYNTECFGVNHFQHAAY